MYLDAQDGMAVLPDGSVRLTPREVQLLLILIEHQGHWVSQDHLSTLMQISENNCRVLINRIRKLTGQPEARWGYGYRTEGWEKPS